MVGGEGLGFYNLVWRLLSAVSRVRSRDSFRMQCSSLACKAAIERERDMNL
jgi:hypothetical protein